MFKEFLKEQSLLIDYESYLGKLGDLEYINEPKEEGVNVETEMKCYSDQSLSRDYIHLKTLKMGKEQFGFYLHKYKVRAICVLLSEYAPENKKWNIPANSHRQVILEVLFKPYPKICEKIDKHAIQVDNAYVLIKYRYIHLAITCYLVLVERGYTMVSDNVHFLGGQGLWKAIGNRANSIGFNVDVRDENTGEIVFKNYSPKEISDDLVWTKNEEDKVANYVFVLTEI